jgi:hypothetical protein
MKLIGAMTRWLLLVLASGIDLSLFYSMKELENESKVKGTRC